MKRSLALAATLLTTLTAAAQTTAVTALNERMAGAPISTGTVSFTAVNAGRAAVPFADAAGNGNGPEAFQCQLVNGALTGNLAPDGTVTASCTVPDSTLTAPPVQYMIQVCDTSVGLATSQNCYTEGPATISGPTWQLDRFAPSTTVPVAQAFTLTVGSGAPPSTCIAPAEFRGANNGAVTAYTCYGGVFVAFGGGGGGTSTPASSTAIGGVQLASGVGTDILAKVASTGSYADLTNLPTLPAAFNGGIVANPILLPADPTAPLQAATKQYVDGHGGGTSTPASSTAPGLVELSPGQTSNVIAKVASTGSYADLLNLPTIPAAFNGGAVSTPITLPADPTAALQAATKQYVDGHSSSAAAAGAPGSVQIASGSASLSASLPVQEFTRIPKPEMFSWLQALHNCSSQVVYATALTDSRGVVWQGDGSSEGPTLPNQRYLDLFTAAVDQGCAWHGTGFVPYVKFLVPGSPNPNNLFYTGVSGFSGYDTSFGPVQTNPVNGSVWSPTAVFNAGGGFTYTLSAIGKSVDTVRVLCEAGSGLGTWNIAITNSSTNASLATMSCGGGSSAKAAQLVTSSTFSAAVVNVTFSCASASCGYYATEASVGSVGFELNNLGAASGAAELYSTGTAFAFIDQMPPVSLLMTDFGTNDPNLGYTNTQYSGALTTIVSHFKAQSTNPSVVITYPPVSNNSESAATFASYAASAYSVVQALGTAWTNYEDEWGTVFVPGLFSADGVHPNTLGSQLEYDQLLGTAMDFASVAGAGTASSGASSGSTYNPAAVAITGGNIDGVALGANAAIKSLSIDTSTAGSGAYLFAATGSLGSFKTDGAGNFVSTGNGTFGNYTATYWAPAVTTDATGSGCSPNGTVLPSTANGGEELYCHSGTWTNAIGGGGGGSSASPSHPTSVSAGTMSLTPGSNTTGQTFNANYAQTDDDFTVQFTVSAAYGSASAVLKIGFGAAWALYPSCSFDYSGDSAASNAGNNNTVPLYPYLTDKQSVYIFNAASLAAGTYQVHGHCTN